MHEPIAVGPPFADLDEQMQHHLGVQQRLNVFARLLADQPTRLRADLLKVGHHGSRTSTGARFVATVRPGAAVISCGVRNRFGHPHDVTLQTLAATGVMVARTDRPGAPWHLVPADDKRFARIQVLETVCRALDAAI